MRYPLMSFSHEVLNVFALCSRVLREEAPPSALAYVPPCQHPTGEGCQGHTQVCKGFL